GAEHFRTTLDRFRLVEQAADNRSPPCSERARLSPVPAPRFASCFRLLWLARACSAKHLADPGPLAEVRLGFLSTPHAPRLFLDVYLCNVAPAWPRLLPFVKLRAGDHSRFERQQCSESREERQHCRQCLRFVSVHFESEYAPLWR